MKKIVSFIFLVLLLSSCATGYYAFVGPTNKTQSDFMQARYSCLQETQQRVSSAYANQYGGSSSSIVAPSCSAFKACLAARGFYEQNGVTDLSFFNQPGHFSIPQGTMIDCH